MKVTVKTLAKSLLGIAILLVAFAILYNVFYHGSIYSDWRARDASSEDELRLLARIVRNNQFSGASDWPDKLLAEYENSKEPALRDSKFIRDNYIFFGDAFIEKEIPLILPKEKHKGSYVVLSSGLVVWYTKHQLDDALSDVK